MEIKDSDILNNPCLPSWIGVRSEPSWHIKYQHRAFITH